MCVFVCVCVCVCVSHVPLTTDATLPTLQCFLAAIQNPGLIHTACVMRCVLCTSSSSEHSRGTPVAGTGGMTHPLSESARRLALVREIYRRR